MLCDVCGKRFRPEAGQVTADTILCGDCAARVRDKAAGMVREAVDDRVTPAPDVPADGIVRAELEKGPNYKPRDMTVIFGDDPHAPDLGGEGG